MTGDAAPAPPHVDPPAPPRGLYGVGAAGLVFEALVLLLAAPAVATANRGHVPVGGIVYVLVLAVLCIVAAGVLRRPGGIVFATVLQVLVVAAGVVTWPMYVVGIVFAGIWAYWLHLRRTAT